MVKVMSKNASHRTKEKCGRSRAYRLRHILLASTRFVLDSCSKSTRHGQSSTDGRVSSEFRAAPHGPSRLNGRPSAWWRTGEQQHSLRSPAWTLQLASQRLLAGRSVRLVTADVRPQRSSGCRTGRARQEKPGARQATEGAAIGRSGGQRPGRCACKCACSPRPSAAATKPASRGCSRSGSIRESEPWYRTISRQSSEKVRTTLIDCRV